MDKIELSRKITRGLYQIEEKDLDKPRHRGQIDELMKKSKPELIAVYETGFGVTL